MGVQTTEGWVGIRHGVGGAHQAEEERVTYEEDE